MTSSIYPSAKASFETAGFNLGTDTIVAVLVDNTHAYTSTDVHASDLGAAGAAIIGGYASKQVLAGKTTTGGVFNATSPVTFPSVTSGKTVGGIAIIKDVDGTAANAILIAFIDHDNSAAPIALPTNGGNISITWDTGANKIFAL